MSLLEITCNCGHTDDFERFASTPISGELPHDTIQCPKCLLAIKRVPDGHRIAVGGGRYVNKEIKLIEVNSVL